MAHKFAPTSLTERQYRSHLRKIARTVGGIVKAHVIGSALRDEKTMLRLLEQYAEALEPWAQRVAATMIESVSKRNKQAWAATSQQIGQALRHPIEESAIRSTVTLLRQQQVALITSLPEEAGRRAQKLVQEAAMDGTRASAIAEELLRTEDVTVHRADTIARTEIAKANAALTQARAEYVGATHYVWETAKDADVRPSHARLQGKIFRFDDPPEVDEGRAYNPGEFPNCRCFAVPVVTDAKGREA